MKERLQKILARAGYGSRRAAELLIVGGRVRVNDEPAMELGVKADPEVDVIEVDGKTLQVETKAVHLVMNKPWGFVTTARDPQGRPTVMTLLPPDIGPHVLPVGRLDRDTEGLLIFTNDGELAHRLAHPRFQIEKEYYAQVKGAPSSDALNTLHRGVELGGRTTSPAEADLAPPPYGFEQRSGYTWLRIAIHEGRKRQVRLMCSSIGHPVRALVRTRIADISLGRLAKGKTRPMSRQEVASLERTLGMAVRAE